MNSVVEEQEDLGCVIKKSKKRKLSGGKEEDDNGILINNNYLSLDELLNQDLLEKVLSWLPTSSFFCLRSVCKRWNSFAESASFRLACSQISSREPWLFMVDDHNNLDQSITVYDTFERNWKHLPVTTQPSYPPFDYLRLSAQHYNNNNNNNNCNLIPVAASGGLICFRSVSTNGFVICNPVTRAFRELPPLPPTSQTQPLHAIAMNSSSSSSYNLILVSGEVPNLSVIFYDSGKDCWEDEIRLNRRKDESSVEPPDHVAGDDDQVHYFLSKGGDVMATNNMQRSPTKQYSSVITVKDGKEIIHFLSSSGIVMACNPVGKCFYEYPRLLPVFLEYSIDVVECKGEMLVVVLSEFLESASLRVWRFSEEDRSWSQVSVMPPSMSHEFYGKKADINCVGSGDHVLICVNSGGGGGGGRDFNSCVLCDLVGNEWIELPKCYVNGKPKEFMSAFSFEPRIEACV